MSLDLTGVVPIYQDNIDSLIDQLGKNVILTLGKITTDCPNCEYDSIRKRSSGRYQSGGPIPFSDGTVCPYCEGRGKIETENTATIKALVKWNPRDFNRMELNINEADVICRLKTYLSDVPNLKRASSIIVDSDARRLSEHRMYLLREPTPVGLQSSRYAVSYWRQNKNG